MKRILPLLLALLLCLPALAETPADIDFGTDLCAAAYIGYGEDIGSVLRAPETAALLAATPSWRRSLRWTRWCCRAARYTASSRRRA